MTPNQERLMDALRAAVTGLHLSYPPGCWNWARENRSDLTRPLEQAADRVDKAIHAGDPEAFTRSLEAYMREWRTLSHEYRRSTS